MCTHPSVPLSSSYTSSLVGSTLASHQQNHVPFTQRDHISISFNIMVPCSLVDLQNTSFSLKIWNLLQSCPKNDTFKRISLGLFSISFNIMVPWIFVDLQNTSFGLKIWNLIQSCPKNDTLELKLGPICTLNRSILTFCGPLIWLYSYEPYTLSWISILIINS